MSRKTELARRQTADTAVQAAATQWSQEATTFLVQLLERVDALAARVEALERARTEAPRPYPWRRRRRRRPRVLVVRALARRGTP